MIPQIPDRHGNNHDHPLPGNELQEVYFDKNYEGGTNRYPSWVPGFSGTPNAMSSIVVEKINHYWVPKRKETGKVDPIYRWPETEVVHRPVLDLDFPVKVVPSSTEGHFHLYLDKEMGWETYRKLLEALAEAGILEPGYVGASVAREHTTVRLPWVSKDEMDQDIEVTDR